MKIIHRQDLLLPLSVLPDAPGRTLDPQVLVQVLVTPLFFIKESFGSWGEETGALFTAKFFIPRMEQVGPMQAPMGVGVDETIMLLLLLTESCGLRVEAGTVQIC